WDFTCCSILRFWLICSSNRLRRSRLHWQHSGLVDLSLSWFCCWLRRISLHFCWLCCGFLRLRLLGLRLRIICFYLANDSGVIITRSISLLFSFSFARNLWLSCCRSFLAYRSICRLRICFVTRLRRIGSTSLCLRLSVLRLSARRSSSFGFSGRGLGCGSCRGISRFSAHRLGVCR